MRAVQSRENDESLRQRIRSTVAAIRRARVYVERQEDLEQPEAPESDEEKNRGSEDNSGKEDEKVEDLQLQPLSHDSASEKMANVKSNGP